MDAEEEPCKCGEHEHPPFAELITHLMFCHEGAEAAIERAYKNTPHRVGCIAPWFKSELQTSLRVRDLPRILVHAARWKVCILLVS